MSMTMDDLQRLVKLLACLDSNAPAEPPSTAEDLQIVVADRGHVWVGLVTVMRDVVTIRDARVVCRWGSERGLNQLANEGPLPNTKLDAPASVIVERRAVIARIPCSVSAWGKIYG